jgi:hypothetical protein
MSTLIELTGRLRPLSTVRAEPIIGRITENPASTCAHEILLVRDEAAMLPPGFAGYLCHHDNGRAYPPDSLLLRTWHKETLFE